MAYGNEVQGNILNSFSAPAWLVDMANIMVIIHLLPAYQVRPCMWQDVGDAGRVVSKHVFESFDFKHVFLILTSCVRRCGASPSSSTWRATRPSGGASVARPRPSAAGGCAPGSGRSTW
jgi:hypothetical protein